MDIEGAAFTAITMHNDAKSWVKLTKFKVRPLSYPFLVLIPF